MSEINAARQDPALFAAHMCTSKHSHKQASPLSHTQTQRSQGIHRRSPSPSAPSAPSWLPPAPPPPPLDLELHRFAQALGARKEVVEECLAARARTHDYATWLLEAEEADRAWELERESLIWDAMREPWAQGRAFDSLCERVREGDEACRQQRGGRVLEMRREEIVAQQREEERLQQLENMEHELEARLMSAGVQPSRSRDARDGAKSKVGAKASAHLLRPCTANTGCYGCKQSR